jgi:hypothetical protein
VAGPFGTRFAASAKVWNSVTAAFASPLSACSQHFGFTTLERRTPLRYGSRSVKKTAGRARITREHESCASQNNHLSSVVKQRTSKACPLASFRWRRRLRIVSSIGIDRARCRSRSSPRIPQEPKSIHCGPLAGRQSLSGSQCDEAVYGGSHLTSGNLRNVAASVHQKLLNIAKREGADFGLVLTRYALERLLYRLSQSGYRNQFILKGAMLFQVWTRTPHRPTRDLDLLGKGDPSPEPSALARSDPLCCAQHNGSWTKPLRGIWRPPIC